MSVAVDEADIVFAAAVAFHVDPDELVAHCRVAHLVAIVAAAEGAPTAVDAAAAILVGVIQRRPFAASEREHRAAAWLAAATLLARHRLTVDLTDDAVRGLLDDADRRALTAADVADVLRPHVVPTPGRARRVLRRLAAPSAPRAGQPLACPSCARRITVNSQDVAWFSSPGAGDLRLTLVAICARQHGAHGRYGGPLSAAEPRPERPLFVPVVTAPANPRDAFVAIGPGGALAFIPRPDSDAGTYDVLPLGEPTPGDLCGDWERFYSSTSPVANVAREAVSFRGHGSALDVAHLSTHAPAAADLLMIATIGASV